MSSSNRVLIYLKSEARSRALTNEQGEVSAADIRNVMRSHIDGSARGGTVTKAFFDLMSEGFLSRTKFTETNPDTRHQVAVYKLSNW